MKYLWEIILFFIFAFFMVSLINRRENYLADYMNYCHCRCPLEPQIPNQ